MKRLLISLIFLLVFSAVSFGQSDGWVYFASTDDGDKFWYQSTSVVEIEKHTFKVWEKNLFAKPFEDGTQYFLTLEQVKCNQRQVKNTRIVAYDKNDKRLRDNEYPDNTFEDVIPGSVAARFVEAICDNYDK